MTASLLEQDCRASRPPGRGAAVSEILARLDREAVFGVCDSGRYRCSYYTWGEGPPLLLVPGMGSDARAFALLAGQLTSHFRCIAYELPAGTQDGARLDHYRLADLTADALALLDHLKVQSTYILGVSFGSTIALTAMRKEPARFPRGVLQSGFARRPLAPAEVLLAKLARHWRGTLASLPFRTALLRRCHFCPFASQPAEVWQFFLDHSERIPIAAAAHRALLIHQVNLRPILPEIRQPILLVTGDADPLVNAACEEELLAGLANAGQVRLENCGHHAQFTHPAELAEVMRSFLTPGCAETGAACGAQTQCGKVISGGVE